MAALTEARHTAAFILSEANGQRSRESGVLDTGDLAAGTVLQLSGTKLVAFTAADATDGTADIPAAGILIGAADATSADQAVAFIARDAEVNLNLLTYPAGKKAATVASLKLLGIICRE